MLSTKMYGELAEWWPLISAPEDYQEEAEYFLPLLLGGSPGGRPRILELGSGGGNNAFHLKRHALVTLVDLSPEMVAISQRLNPDCEHHTGDMRTVRLGQAYDAVFIHDAIMYMIQPSDFDAAIQTASLHCRPGGRIVVAPDYTMESFTPGSDQGGHDKDGVGARYLEWVHPRTGRNFYTDYVFALKGADGQVKVVHDRHQEGLLSLDEWKETFRRWGSSCRTEDDPWDRTILVGDKDV